MNKNRLVDVLDRLKLITHSRTDSELARTLGISAQTLSSWKVRDSIPYPLLLDLAISQGLSLDWLLLGEGTCERAACASAALQAEPWEVDFLEQLRTLAPSDISAIRAYAHDKVRLQQLQRQLDERVAPNGER